MEFSRSTQAKSWLFNSSSSLEACKVRAVNLDDVASVSGSSVSGALGRVRKFASGFTSFQVPTSTEQGSMLSWRDQEILLQFHAQQMHALAGPCTIIPDLSTSNEVLLTAITFLRRFYLSNSVVDISPRKMSVACVFLAAKVEEEKVEACALQHATSVLQDRVGTSPLCRRELRAVSEGEILAAEEILMKGLNYQFRCYHSSTVVDSLLLSLGSNEMGPDSAEEREDNEATEAWFDPVGAEGSFENNSIRHMSVAIAQRAQIFSDVLFLYTPWHIAIAVIAIATGLVNQTNCCQQLLVSRVTSDLIALVCRGKQQKELAYFEEQVGDVIRLLVNCPEMELRSTHGGVQREIMSRRAEELKRILSDVASKRSGYRSQHRKSLPSRKRSRVNLDFTPPNPPRLMKYAKVTPPGGFYAGA